MNTQKLPQNNAVFGAFIHHLGITAKSQREFSHTSERLERNVPCHVKITDMFQAGRIWASNRCILFSATNG
jgi:hypothetical protein